MIKKILMIPIIFLILGIIIGFISGTNHNFKFTPIKTELLFIDVLSHNLMIIFYILIGSLTFGIVSIFIIVLNGIVVGILVGSFWDTKFSTYVFLNIFPHGIIEIISYIFAFMGALLIQRYIWNILKYRKNKSLSNINLNMLKCTYLYNAFKFIIASIILIFISTIIEVF